MATTNIKIDAVLYPLLGIGAYWAWSSSVMITAGIWPERIPDSAQIDWMANVVTHGSTLLVLSFFLRNLRAKIRTRAWGIACASLIALGTVLMIANNFGMFALSLGLLGSVVSGAGCGGALLYWAQALMAVRQPEAQRVIISGSVVAGLVATVLILCLPQIPGMLVCVVLPFALLLCSRVDKNGEGATAGEGVGEGAGEGAGKPSPVQEVSSATPKRRFFDQLSLYLCCFILALAAGMYQNASAQDMPVNSIEQWRTLYASVFMLVSVALYLDYRLQTTQLAKLFSQLIVPLIAGGLLIFSVVGGGFGGWGGVVMQTGYQLFLIYIYSEFALKEAISSKHLMVFVRGTIAIDVGLLGGFFFMVCTGAGFDVDLRNVSLAVVYLLLLVGVLLFPNVIANVVQRSVRSRFVLSGQEERDGFDARLGSALAGEEAQMLQGAHAGLPSDAMVNAFVAQYGFSPREREIFEYLLRGRTLPAIAEDAHLSYNTVKTHVSHIYQKMGVHTRDEMIDVAENWFSERMK